MDDGFYFVSQGLIFGFGIGSIVALITNVICFLKNLFKEG